MDAAYSLQPFFEKIPENTRQNIIAVYMDRNAGYPNVVRKYCPKMENNEQPFQESLLANSDTGTCNACSSNSGKWQKMHNDFIRNRAGEANKTTCHFFIHPACHGGSVGSPPDIDWEFFRKLCGKSGQNNPFRQNRIASRFSQQPDRFPAKVLSLCSFDIV